jgi:tetratricopeptide (TPR) repeat protein
MTTPAAPLTRDRSSTQFLFSESLPARNASECPEPAVRTDVSPLLETPESQALTASAMEVLSDVSLFSVLVLHIDCGQGEKPARDEARQALLSAVEPLFSEQTKISGWLSEDTLGLFVPEQDREAAKQAAGVIQQQVPHSVSVGIAAYPQINFSRQCILTNARKALAHAAFFGPGAVVVFDAVSLNISGDAFYQEGHLPEAIEEYQAALQIDPSNINVQNSLGVCQAILEDFDAARICFETATWLDPREVLAVYNLGLVHLLTNAKEQALDCFLKAFEIDGNIFEVALQTGRLHLEMNRPDSALAFLKKATEIKPESGSAFRWLGDCLLAMDQPEAACRAYQAAAKNAPNDAAALSALGYLFDRLGENIEIATLFCRQSVLIEPENALFHHRLATIYLKQDFIDQALDAFRTANALGYDETQVISEIQSRKEAQQPISNVQR